jgi:hypothetical protein
MIAQLCLHYPHILVFTVELDKQLWYQLGTTYSYLDRWGFIYHVVSIFTRQYIYKWWYYNLLCMIYWHYYSQSNWISDSGIISEQWIHIWLGGVPCRKLLVSLLESIIIKYCPKIIFALFSNTSIHIQTQYTTDVSVPIDIFISGPVE